MKEKMPWLKTRLRELGRTPTALAKALGIAAPRVYEMIAGRRHIQQSEIAPMAEFLDWSIEEINRHLPAHSRLPLAVITHAPGAGMTETSAVIRQVCEMVKSAPKPVDMDEIRDAVLTMITERFAGRPIGMETIERGLALACFQVKMQALSRAPT